MPATGRTALYRAFDANDKLLYVGITDGVETRFKVHQKNAEWWPLMVRRDIEWFDTRRDAMRAEAAAIVGEGPLYNKQTYGPEHQQRWLPRSVAKYSIWEKDRKAIYRRRKAAEAAALRLEQSVRDGKAAGLPNRELAQLSGLSAQQVRKIVAATPARETNTPDA